MEPELTPEQLDPAGDVWLWYDGDGDVVLSRPRGDEADSPDAWEYFYLTPAEMDALTAAWADRKKGG